MKNDNKTKDKTPTNNGLIQAGGQYDFGVEKTVFGFKCPLTQSPKPL